MVDTLAAFFAHGFFVAHFLMLHVVFLVHSGKLVHAFVHHLFFFLNSLIHYFFPLPGIFAPAFLATFSAIAIACFFGLPADSSVFIFSPMAFLEPPLTRGIFHLCSCGYDVFMALEDLA